MKDLRPQDPPTHSVVGPSPPVIVKGVKQRCRGVTGPGARVDERRPRLPRHLSLVVSLRRVRDGCTDTYSVRVPWVRR